MGNHEQSGSVCMADALSQHQHHLIEMSFEMAKCLGTLFHESEELTIEKGKIQNFDHTKAQELAQSIIKKITENDVLISSLPKSFSTEQEQLTQIQQLLDENKRMDEELAYAESRAIEVQTQISDRLKELSNKIYGIRSKENAIDAKSA